MSSVTATLPLLTLSDYEAGRAVAAIEAIARQQKPITEVGCRVADREQLEADLQCCLDAVREPGCVSYWIRGAGPLLRFGFYAEEWVLDALTFLDRAKLKPKDRAWINGLLFGYNVGAIQRFITAGLPESEPRSQHVGSSDTVGTRRLDSRRSRIRSTGIGKSRIARSGGQ